MQIWERNAGWECDAGSGARCGFWSATRVLERDAARHVATNAPSSQQKAVSIHLGVNLLPRGIRQSFVRYWMEWVQTW